MASYEELMTMAQRAHSAGQAGHARQLVQMANKAKANPTPAADMSMWGRIKDNVIGVDDGIESGGEYLAGLLNKGGQGAMFGFGDEADAAVRSLHNGKSYGDNLTAIRAKEQDFSDRHPVASTAAEIGGAVLPALATAGASAAPSTIRGGMALGAGQGALYGFGSGDGGVQNRAEQSALGVLLGGTLGAAAPAAGKGVRAMINGSHTRRAITEAAKGAPTSEQLRAAGNAAYKQIEDAGVQIKPGAYENARQNILGRLRSESGFDELPGPSSLTPGTSRVADIMKQATDRMAQEPTAALPFRSLDQMRRQAGAAAGNVTNKADQQAGSVVIDGLDDFVAGLRPEDVVAGDAAKLKSAIPAARETWGRMRRSQMIDDAISQEENYLSGGASAIRNQFASILRNPKKAKSFSDAEKAAMRRVVRGTPTEATLNLLGSGLGGLGQIGFGAAAGGVPGAIAGAATSAATRRMSEAITRRNAEIARAAIASGRLSTLPALPADSALQRLLIRSISRGGNAALN